MMNRMILILLLLTVATEGNLLSQSGTSAVMQVQVEVLPASHFDSRIHQDLSDQVTAVVYGDENSKVSLDLGQFTISVPEGVEFSTRFDSSITMSDGKSEWTIDSQVDSLQGERGNVTYEMKGHISSEKVQQGSWQGQQVATIEYH